MSTDKVRENRLRRKAARLGLGLRKGRARTVRLDNFGEYMIYDLEGNYVVAGERFDYDLDDVERWLNEYEANIKASRESEKISK